MNALTEFFQNLSEERKSASSSLSQPEMSVAPQRKHRTATSPFEQAVLIAHINKFFECEDRSSERGQVVREVMRQINTPNREWTPRAIRLWFNNNKRHYANIIEKKEEARSKEAAPPVHPIAAPSFTYSPYPPPLPPVYPQMVPPLIPPPPHGIPSVWIPISRPAVMPPIGHPLPLPPTEQVVRMPPHGIPMNIPAGDSPLHVIHVPMKWER